MADQHAALVLSAPTQLDNVRIVEAARAFAEASQSSATQRAYACQWAKFEAWCDGRQLCPLPALGASVALFLSDLASSGTSVATLAQGLAAIAHKHKRAACADPRQCPEVQTIWEGIRRTLGEAPRQARPISPDQLRRLVKTGKGLGAVRDRALLLVGFAGGFRRSELVALDVLDVREDTDGLVITIRKSKTDQTGKGRELGVPYGSDPATCPVRSLRAWLNASSITEGAIFRGVRYGRLTPNRLDGRDVARVVQRAAKRAGVSTELLSGHSLRAGLATTAAKAGKSIAAIQAQTGHKSVAMVQRYVRAGTIFEDNAASGIGL